MCAASLYPCGLGLVTLFDGTPELERVEAKWSHLPPPQYCAVPNLLVIKKSPADPACYADPTREHLVIERPRGGARLADILEAGGAREATLDEALGVIDARLAAGFKISPLPDRLLSSDECMDARRRGVAAPLSPRGVGPLVV